MATKELYSIRRGEIADAKRCLKRWYWAWRKGLVPRAAQFGALEFGTWMHAALADWYKPGSVRHRNSLQDLFHSHAAGAMYSADQAGAPDHLIEQAEKLSALGKEMASAYQREYATEHVKVIRAEVPLEFTIPDRDNKLVARYKFKPDLLYVDDQDLFWIMEHKTATTIRTEHLALDIQANGMAAMAEQALRKTELLPTGTTFAGVMYNFLRKALPDERPTNTEGKYLNQDGSVSKKQPPPYFRRYPVRLTRKKKAITLRRLQADVLWVTALTEVVHARNSDPGGIPKTTHYSCAKTCPFFTMCVAEEEGTNIRDMERAMFIRRNPYLYEEEHHTTDERPGFELSG